MYSARVWDDDGVLVRNLIPCKDPSDAIGMYDLVNGVFYYNAGTGTFIAGSPVYVDYLDFKNQEVVRNIEVIDDTGTLPIDQSLRGLANPVEESITLPTIMVNKGDNVFEVDTNIDCEIEVNYRKEK